MKKLIICFLLATSSIRAMEIPDKPTTDFPQRQFTAGNPYTQNDEHIPGLRQTRVIKVFEKAADTCQTCCLMGCCQALMCCCKLAGKCLCPGECERQNRF